MPSDCAIALPLSSARLITARCSRQNCPFRSVRGSREILQEVRTGHE
jgi:hypothetical protein